MAPSPLLLSLAIAAQVSAPDTLVVRTETEGPNLTAVPGLRLGSLDGPEETTFGLVAGIAVGLGHHVPHRSAAEKPETLEGGGGSECGQRSEG